MHNASIFRQNVHHGIPIYQLCIRQNVLNILLYVTFVAHTTPDATIFKEISIEEFYFISIRIKRSAATMWQQMHVVSYCTLCMIVMTVYCAKKVI